MSERLGSRRSALALSALLALCCLLPIKLQAADAPLIFAAASLKDGLDAVLERYQQLTQRSVKVSYAGTPVLARQIEAGAPAQLFFSADQQWMDYLEERQLVNAQSRVDVLGNAMVLVSRAGCGEVAGDKLDATTLARWLGDGGLAMAHPETVPAGRYGQAALRHLALWKGLRGRIIEVENVRLALMLAARGEVELALVYASDATVEPAVDICYRFAADAHAAIRYPLVAVEAELTPADSALLAFLRGPEAAKVWQAHGFEAPLDSALPVSLGDR